METSDERWILVVKKDFNDMIEVLTDIATSVPITGEDAVEYHNWASSILKKVKGRRSPDESE
jgi:hypothetical protein